MIRISFLLLLFFCLFSGKVYSQSMTGVEGLLKAPNARLLEDRHFKIGTTYIPPGYFRRTSGFNSGLISGNAALTYFVNLNILPFMDVMFRYTDEMNYKVLPYRQYFPDKMFAFKLQALKEKGWRPSVVIGANDFTSSLELTANSFFSTSYIVASKKFDYQNHHVDLSLGYAPDYDFLRAKDIKGVFYGFEYKNDLFKYGSILFDYDSQHFNVGARTQLFKRLNATIGIYDMKKSFFTLSYETEL